MRASKKLRGDEILVANLGSTVLRKHLDDVPLWRGDHVSIKQLVLDFASYLYLPRLSGPDVLVNAIRSGLALLTWQTDTFAHAESFDDTTKRYRGLRVAQQIAISPDSPDLLVKPAIALRQMEAEIPTPLPAGAIGLSERVNGDGSPIPPPGGTNPPIIPTPPATARLKRFHGSVNLGSIRVGLEASKVADEVIAHLASLPNAKVKVTLEIEVEMPEGAPDNVIRTVNENSRTLRFSDAGFEAE